RCRGRSRGGEALIPDQQVLEAGVGPRHRLRCIYKADGSSNSAPRLSKCPPTWVGRVRHRATEEVRIDVVLKRGSIDCYPCGPVDTLPVLAYKPRCPYRK